MDLERAALDAPIAVHGLFEAAARLREQAPWRTHGQGAVTLVKQPDLRVVLMALRAGARVQEHRTVARLLVQTIEGCVRVQVADQTVTLSAGHVLALDRCAAHALDADEDCIILLTIAWPETVPRT